MKLSLNIFFFGWWLARQCWISRGQTLSTPLISTNFSGMVALGEDVTILCKSQDDFYGSFYLTRYSSSSDQGETAETENAVSNQAAFSFSCLSKSQAGMYSCRSCLPDWECSSFSSKIYLNLIDPSLIKPSIQILNPKEQPYFSVWCNGTEPSLTFALMNSRQQIHYKAAEPGEMAVDFSLNSARLKEAENYTCQYHLESSPFVWSVPSDALELPLKDPEMMNPPMETIPGGSSDSGSKTNEHNPAMNLSSDVEEHPDEVSYAILTHQPQKIQQAANPRQTSEPCLYASVVKNTSFQPYMS
ncbi:immunoglobulin superfamily member 1-like isoform X2 [Ahaetulla prasina]|uniref:immunoglobulin superfamily member 1-like isoform X2 n=1 Tax=Ahaetulla prasina TaxID=499056 RepID=UPI0026496BD6|nr:immunoglobulin superfamily member 1-like isoform X2 [Ahaetulla prasina]